MSAWLYIAAFLASGSGKPAPKVPAPRPGLAAAAPQPQAAANFTLNIIPASVSFTATDPDSPLVAGSSTTTVRWTVAGTFFQAWSLSLSSAATTFTNCPTVPISAVTVTCSSASVDGFIGSATCGAASPLSNSSVTVASGRNGFTTTNYSVTLSYTLSDQWTYIARMNPQCTLNITYNALVN
jgi:hypothetical protein